MNISVTIRACLRHIAHANSRHLASIATRMLAKNRNRPLIQISHAQNAGERCGLTAPWAAQEAVSANTNGIKLVTTYIFCEKYCLHGSLFHRHCKIIQNEGSTPSIPFVGPSNSHNASGDWNGSKVASFFTRRTKLFRRLRTLLTEQAFSPSIFYDGRLLVEGHVHPGVRNEPSGTVVPRSSKKSLNIFYPTSWEFRMKLNYRNLSDLLFIWYNVH